VKFKVKEVDNVFVGSSFEIRVVIENESDGKRTVGLTVTLFSVYYHGKFKTKLKQECFSIELEPNNSECVAKLHRYCNGTRNLIIWVVFPNRYVEY